MQEKNRSYKSSKLTKNIINSKKRNVVRNTITNKSLIKNKFMKVKGGAATGGADVKYKVEIELDSQYGIKPTIMHVVGRFKVHEDPKHLTRILYLSFDNEKGDTLLYDILKLINDIPLGDLTYDTPLYIHGEGGPTLGGIGSETIHYQNQFILSSLRPATRTRTLEEYFDGEESNRILLEIPTQKYKIRNMNISYLPKPLDAKVSIFRIPE